MFFYFDFLCLWAMVSIRRLLQVSLPPPCPLPGFRQVCLLFYKKCLINLLLLWSGYFRKIMHFWRKQDFFFKLIAGRFWVCCRLFTALPLSNYESKAVIVFLVSEENKLEVDATFIIVSYLYHFGDVRKESFRYC